MAFEKCSARRLKSAALGGLGDDTGTSKLASTGFGFFFRRSVPSGGLHGPAPKVHLGQQGKHIPGHNNYSPGWSILTADPAELGRHAGTGVSLRPNPPSRLTPSLGQVCQQEGLPPVHGFEELPAGEQRILQSLGVIDYVRQINQERRTPRTVKSRKRKKCSKT